MLYKNNTRNFLIATLTVVFLLGSTDFVWAQSTSLGALFCNAYDNTKVFGTLFSWIAYSAGVVCAIQGIYHLQGHFESRQNHPLKGALGLLTGAAALMAMPSVAAMVISTLVTSGGSSLDLCVAGNAGGGGAQLDQMLAGFVTNIKAPLTALVSIIAIVCGVWMMVHGTMKAAKYGIDPKSNSINSIMANLVFGAILMTIGTSLNTILVSVFGAGTTSGGVGISASTVTAWQFVANVGGGSAQFGNAVAAALTFFQLIGIIAFVRGWLILKKVVEGGGNASMAQGITHIVGGVLAVNIGAFLKIMDATFGTNLM